MTETEKKSTTNPYLNARREWNERYGNYISTAKQWRIIALISLTVCIICIAGVIYFASQNKLIPYIVEVDKQGNTVTVYKNTKMQSIEPPIIRSQLAQFIRDFRSVSADMTVQKSAIKRLYAHIENQSQAGQRLQQYFIKNSPFEQAQEHVVSVDVKQILPLSERTWQIQWLEKTFARDGSKISDKDYTAMVTITIGNNVTEQTILSNPIGLLVNELQWNEDLKN